MSSPAGGLAQYLPGLLHQAGVEDVQLAILRKQATFHGDTSTDEAARITSEAREEHLRRGFGFWEFALRSAVDADFETRRYLLGGALRHKSDEESLERLPVGDFAINLVSGKYEKLPQRTIVTLISEVEIRDSHPGTSWHLPMLDLGAQASADGLAAATDAIRALGLKGMLFESGRSYHFFGAQILSQSETLRLLARAQLLSPIIDARWISHQLIDGHCGLRISTDQERHQVGHRFAATIG